MGSGASALGGSANHRTDAMDGDGSSSAGLELWDVERVAESLERDADLASLAPYARAHAVTGAAALSMDEAKLHSILQDVDSPPSVAPLALLERIQAAVPHSEPKSSTRSDIDNKDYEILGSDGVHTPAADEIPIGRDPLASPLATKKNDENDESPIETSDIISDSKDERKAGRGDADDEKSDNMHDMSAKYEEEEEEEEEEERDDRDHRSFKAQYDPASGQSFFAAFDLGVLNSKIPNGSEDGE